MTLEPDLLLIMWTIILHEYMDSRAQFCGENEYPVSRFYLQNCGIY